MRFHEEETAYEKKSDTCEKIVNIYKELGDVFICDAFGCAHRKHLSIYAMKHFGKPYGYGLLIKKELNLENIFKEKVTGKIQKGAKNRGSSLLRCVYCMGVITTRP